MLNDIVNNKLNLFDIYFILAPDSTLSGASCFGLRRNFWRLLWKA